MFVRGAVTLIVLMRMTGRVALFVAGRIFMGMRMLVLVRVEMDMRYAGAMGMFVRMAMSVTMAVVVPFIMRLGMRRPASQRVKVNMLPGLQICQDNLVSFTASAMCAHISRPPSI